MLANGHDVSYVNIEILDQNGNLVTDSEVELEAELKVLEEFMPKMMSADEMEAAAKKAIEEIPEGDRVLKNIMPKLKEIEGFDMKQAKAIVEKILG